MMFVLQGGIYFLLVVVWFVGCLLTASDPDDKASKGIFLHSFEPDNIPALIAGTEETHYDSRSGFLVS
jgi:hypothetical protein